MAVAATLAHPLRLALPGLVAGAVAIGFSPILVRLSELGPTATGFHRVFLALPLLVLWQRLQNDRPRPQTFQARRAATGIAAAGALFAGDLFFWHLSVVYTTVANATLLANLAPVVVTLGAWLLLGERIRGAFLAGLVVSLFGASLLIGASFEVGSRYVLGDVFGVITAAFYGAYILVVARLRATMPASLIVLGSSAVAAVLLLPLAWLSDESVIASTARGWLTLLALAWLSQAMGQGLIAWALGHLGAAFSSLALLIQPVAAALLGWLMLAESLGPWRLAGGAAVLAGIALARERRSSGRIAA